MDEKNIQHNYVMKYLCALETEGGLGYRETFSNLVNNDLFIPNHIAEFVSKSEPKMWERLLRLYKNDEQALTLALKDEIKSQYTTSQNAALFFHKNRTINFGGETVPLFYVSGTELRGDEDFKKNIFAAVEESSHTILCNGEKLVTIRPDISFYLNGIFIGYLELKTAAMGQNAAEHGRGKIIKDYLCTIKAFVDIEKRIPETAKQKAAVLSIYEKAIHLVASDCNENYVLRNIASLYDYAHAEFRKDVTPSLDSLAPEFVKIFKEYPVTSPSLDAHARFEQVMTALYSKRMIEKEILYYNFMEYRYVRSDKGKTVIAHQGRLISPRPKQKFGCDRIMGRIVEMLDHEKEPNYYMDKLRQELYRLDIPKSKVEEIILKREAYCNNKFVYSLLMQYAAGFGKSNIIGWTALQLKDFRYGKDNAYAYDKIMLVVDRLQLRDQLDTTMTNMNIDKAMFIEAIDKKTFIDALDSPRRIIVVNIQKFLDLQEAINESGKKLQSMRVAFLIDEIHRSNSGENNKEMINLFERLQDSFKKEDGTEIAKKNLLVGFTATPSDETLARFGEFKSAQMVPLWVPFDTYTMKEAIADGYILDPTKHIFPYAVPVKFTSDVTDDDDLDKKIKIRQSKDDVYGFEPRIRNIAGFIVDRLVSLVYGKIRGTGKAMLAVSSIPNAIKYIEIIRDLYNKKCEEKPYDKYADAPICIVYSDSQKYQACASLNGGKNESQVIQDFKSAKNGLIIVVDKLQTGFDEPKLHSLFLDKEISDINAIQTISRVNRSCKNKTECHVIDCSWENKNLENIKLAFKKFCDMAISDYNPEEQAKFIDLQYKNLCGYDLYKTWFDKYKTDKEDASFIITLEDAFRQWIKLCADREEAIKKQNAENGLKEGDLDYITPENASRDLRMYIGQYATAIESIKNVFTINPKYTNADFLNFWAMYCKVFREATKKTGDDNDVVTIKPIDIDDSGFTLIDDDPEEVKKGPKKIHITTTSPKSKTIADILKLINKLNEQEEISVMQVQEWLKELGIFMQWLKDDQDLCATLKDEQFSDEEKVKSFHTSLARYRRTKLKNRSDISDVERFKSLLTDNEAQLYATFMSSLLNPNHEPDFDLDTTNSFTTVTTKEELIAQIEQLYNPTYNEEKVKTALMEMIESEFVNLCGVSYRNLNEVIDSFFVLLKREVCEDLDGLNESIPHNLNKYFFAKNSAPAYKDIFKSILFDLEAYLRKICFLKTGEVFDEHDGFVVVVKSLPSVDELYHTYDPKLQTFKNYYRIIYQWRNDNAHLAPVLPDNEVNAAIHMLLSIFVYSTMVNISDLEINGVLE